MNHKEKLLEVYNLSHSVKDITDVPSEYKKYINEIGEKVFSQKGVYTVLITLVTHKILSPEQDIRYHQSSMEGGFSGRTIDTAYITPTLKELGLPSMAESGWLTRSLEQPYPYTLKYNGKISDRKVKKAFLNIIGYVQNSPDKSEKILRLLLHKAKEVQSRSKVKITPLKNPDKLTIKNVAHSLAKHFYHTYRTYGGSKLPVLAFYALCESLLTELKRYDDCTLAKLGSHTASDRTSKAAGDIQIFKNEAFFEVIEIKSDKAIDSTIVRIAFEKIIKYSPVRYYILSDNGIKPEDKSEIEKIIKTVKEEHGCQIILNGIVQTILYYLRLISSLEKFISNYSILVSNDSELKPIHKEKWNEIIKENLD